ncbi:MAG: hypothetical protein SO253_00930 [Bacilli bacterium]|nr:hypothetical protein [Bacilli bacterium]
MIIKYLLLTLFSELLILLLIIKEKDYRMYLILILTNIISNVSFNLILTSSSNYYLVLYLGEVVVFIVEAFVYYFFYHDIYQSIKVSLLCNLGSLVLGMFL